MRLTDVWGAIPGRPPASSPCATVEAEEEGSAGLCPQELLDGKIQEREQLRPQERSRPSACGVCVGGVGW